MAKELGSTVAARTKRRAAPPRWGLTPREWRAVQRARARLHDILSNGELQSLTLYGSKVRGKARPDSDIDLFLVYNHVTPQQKETLEDYTADLIFEQPRIHVLLYSAEELAQVKGINSLLIYNVSRQGIPLEGAPMPKLEINRREVAEDAIAEAKEKLAAAEYNLNGNFYRDAISRAYYAVLYAADAALATKGFVPKSHSGTNTLFGYHVIQKKRVDAKFKGLFRRIEKARNDADYHPKVPFNREDAEYWLERAKEFVTAIESGIPDWLAE
ncbi:MAG: HEPN domain-containing protein [Chloroflexi bacterium]|nr:HEPN domain-containing protein [Chloroflexota bacterium]